MSISRKCALFIGLLALGSIVILTGSVTDQRKVSLRLPACRDRLQSDRIS
jgi:hypothetical protein